MDPKVAISLMSLQSQVQGLQGGLHKLGTLDSKSFGSVSDNNNHIHHHGNYYHSSPTATNNSGFSTLSNYGRRSSMSDIRGDARGMEKFYSNYPLLNTMSNGSRSLGLDKEKIHGGQDYCCVSNDDPLGGKRPGIESELEDCSSSVTSFKGVREDSGILHAENYSLRKAKRTLEEELEKTRRELAEAQAKINCGSEYRNSKTKANNNGSYLDSDVQKLFELSKFLGDENASLHAKINEMEAELKGLRADKENQETDFRKLSEAIGKAMEEATCAQKTIKSMQEEEIRLKQDKARLETMLKNTVQALENVEKENASITAKAETLELAVLQLQRELSEATRHEPTSTESSVSSQDQQAQGSDSQIITNNNEELEQRIIIPSTPDPSLQLEAEGTFMSVLRSQVCAEGQRLNPEEDAALSLEMQRMASGLSASMLQMEKELLRWKDKVVDLETALTVAKEAADSSDQRATQLISEFRWMQSVLGLSGSNPSTSSTSSCTSSAISTAITPCPSPSPSLDAKMAASKYKLPATIASSAFAGAGMLAAMKFTKYCSQSTAK